jgi:hypothetical protein
LGQGEELFSQLSGCGEFRPYQIVSPQSEQRPEELRGILEVLG